MGNLKLNFLNLSSNSLSGEVSFQLQNQAYDKSFLSNPNLCPSSSLVNLQACNRHSSHHSDKISEGLIAVLIALACLFFLGALCLGLFMLREQRRKKHKDDPKEWKVTYFHTVDVSESNIVKSLINENLIGSGGGGMLYRVKLGRRSGEMVVAVKKISNSRKQDSRLEEEFQAEAQILGSIRHVNIAKLFSCISNSDSKLLIYEYMENGSLDRWLHSSRRGDHHRPSTLDWPARLGIAICPARRLC